MYGASESFTLIAKSRTSSAAACISIRPTMVPLSFFTMKVLENPFSLIPLLYTKPRAFWHGVRNVTVLLFR